MKTSATMLSAFLLLGAGGCTTMASAPSLSANTVTSYVPLAAVSDTFEIETSRLAIERSRDPQVRRFAREMIRDHRLATERLQRATRSAGMTPPPPALDARHGRMLEQLSAAPTARFDALYLAQQAQAHQEAIAIHSAFARNGDDPALVRHARRTLPVVEMHAEHVQAMLGQDGGM